MPPTNPRNDPNAGRQPEREVQALREAGHTEITRPVAALLAGLFLATLVAVPALRPWSGAAEAPLAPFGELADRLRKPPEKLRESRPAGAEAALSGRDDSAGSGRR